MFIIETIPPKEATGELKLLYRKIERVLGFVPPHFELFAKHSPFFVIIIKTLLYRVYLCLILLKVTA